MGDIEIEDCLQAPEEDTFWVMQDCEGHVEDEVRVARALTRLAEERSREELYV